MYFKDVKNNFPCNIVEGSKQSTPKMVTASQYSASSSNPLEVSRLDNIQNQKRKVHTKICMYIIFMRYI
jgi:hypothetical protein